MRSFTARRRLLGPWKHLLSSIRPAESPSGPPRPDQRPKSQKRRPKTAPEPQEKTASTGTSTRPCDSCSYSYDYLDTCSYSQTLFLTNPSPPRSLFHLQHRNVSSAVTHFPTYPTLSAQLPSPCTTKLLPGAVCNVVQSILPVSRLQPPQPVPNSRAEKHCSTHPCRNNSS